MSGDSEVVDKNSRDSQTQFLDMPSKPARNDSDVIISCSKDIFQSSILENLPAVM